MRIAVLAGLVLAVAGCSQLPGTRAPVIDTWPVGDPADCYVSDPARTCDELVAAGLEALTARDGPADVVSWHLHREGTRIDPVTGQQYLSTRSGGSMSVLVVELADGTRRAIGVAFPGISSDAVAFPWAADP